MKISIEHEGISVTITEDIVQVADAVRLAFDALIAVRFPAESVYENAVEVAQMELYANKTEGVTR